jgi:two-component system, chemotaxis family, protein-glutamate methylesterase/glutaminase
MKKIRVLVVDDSVVIRRLLTDILSQDPEIEVVGTAPNGRIALAKIPQLNPDLITLDIEMPDMDGLQTLPPLRKVYPKLPVIMFSTLTERGANATLEAMALGATDYVAKPANVGSVAAGMDAVKAQIIPKIKSLCPITKPVSFTPQPVKMSAGNATGATLNRLIHRSDILVIGSSTGGPQALAALITKLPANFPIPIAIVQHMPPVFTKQLAARLHQESALEVHEATGGEVLRAGQVFIAPGDHHLELRRRGTEVITTLNQGPPENSCRPAVDVLFRSASEIYGTTCLGLVLTGMGRDGARGAEHIVHNGGIVYAQDEATSVVWGMPRAVAEAGLARKILPLPEIPGELIRQVSVSRRSVLSTEGAL